MRAIIFLIALIMFPLRANAVFVELNSGFFDSSDSGTGTGRSIGFQALADFSIDSIGIFGELNLESFDAQIYSSTDGNQAVELLASETAEVGGTGNGWNDIAIDYSFDEDAFYVLNWRPTDGGDSDWATTIDFYRDSALPLSIMGLVMSINGARGFDADDFSFDNTLHANFRIDLNKMPVPATIWLFCTALIGLAGFAKRIKTTPTSA